MCKIWLAKYIEEQESNKYINNRDGVWICCSTINYSYVIVKITHIKFHNMTEEEIIEIQKTWNINLVKKELEYIF